MSYWLIFSLSRWVEAVEMNQNFLIVTLRMACTPTVNSLFIAKALIKRKADKYLNEFIGFKD